VDETIQGPIKQKGARRSERPCVLCKLAADIAAGVRQYAFFFSAHLLVEASHMPPAFSQSAALVACVTSPAKAGPVKASASAKATIETRVFMTFSPLRLYSGGTGEQAWWRLFQDKKTKKAPAEADASYAMG
jgi:hypothetical protein